MEPWIKGATIYQIYPRSFADSNGDGVGDLRGASEKLGYIADLGVDGIWLSPFFTSPMKDFGYDVAEYCAVDPLFGTLADFDALVERAHALGLKVVIDQVYSHTSDQHAWFAESRSSRDNSKADWYVWADPKPDGAPPNNWQSLFGGPSWEWDTRRRQYYLHNFLVEQPDLNVRKPEVQDALLGAARFWLERGVDGFRLDVANFYVQDSALRDNPARQVSRGPARPWQYQRHVYDRSQPETLAFHARLRALLDQYHACSVGEIGDEDPLARQREYTEGPDRLHTAYSFFLLDAHEASADLFRRALAGWTHSSGWPSWSLSNHDVPRFPTRLAHGDDRLTRLLMGALLSLRGSIFLYQGDELGFGQAHVPYQRLRDPQQIRFYPDTLDRDGARTPMAWTDRGGFSDSADLWLPMDGAHLPLNAAAQARDPQSMLAFTKALVKTRNTHAALRLGAWRALDSEDTVLAFERSYQSERLVCVFNFADRGTVFKLANARVLPTPLGGALSNDLLTLPPFAGAIAALQ